MKSRSGRLWRVPMAAGPHMLPLVLIALAIGALTTGGILLTLRQHYAGESARLEAIADLKTRQIADWLHERRDDARFAQTSVFFAETYRRWREAGDLVSRDLLQARLKDYQQFNPFESILLLDERGEPLWDSAGDLPAVDPALSAAAQHAAANRQTSQLGPYRDPAGRLWLDFLAPLSRVGKPLVPVVVLRVVPADFLYPILQTWPVPSASGETLLVRRDGDDVVYLNDLRHRADAALRLRLPIGGKALLAAQVLGGQTPPGSLMEGVDYRGVPAIGVGHVVPGADWLLVAKEDRAEVRAKAAGAVLGIGLAGLLALGVVGIGVLLWRQHDNLAAARREGALQAEKLRALRLLDAIANGSSDAIYARDMAGRCLLLNKAAAAMLGQPADAVLGRDDTAFLPPEQAERVRAMDRQVMAEGRLLNLEENLSLPDGARAFLTVKGPLRDADGTVFGMFGISRDITERKQAEETLRARESLLRAVVDNTPFEFWARDLEERCFMENPLLVEHWGSILGRRPEDTAIAPETLSLWKANNRRAFGGEVVDEEVSYRVGDEQRSIENIVAPIRMEGEIRGILGLNIDITDRQRLIEELDRHRHHLEELVAERTAQLTEAREAAESASRAKSAFLANMSHEIRTPLNAILGLTHLLKQAEPIPAQADRLNKIDAAARHLLAILNDVLDLSKIEAGKLVLEQSDFHLGSLLDQVRTLMAEPAQAKGLTLAVDGDPAPDWLRGDATRLRQALLNYAGNAVKFTERGTIALRARLLEEATTGLLVRFEVRDTGIGLTPDQQRRIFAAFEQADVST
ncbi:MAG: PAS domain-containing protein, partial [Candidatus Competibacter sp.]|nr:PAS domain-containing protein [Candidatus Competibacter sp.]